MWWIHERNHIGSNQRRRWMGKRRCFAIGGESTIVPESELDGALREAFDERAVPISNFTSGV